MRRLIEEAFPLKKVSEDSKHEKNVFAGHISTLHVWPARRPLAACRAVTIATLLPDPADSPTDMRDEYARLANSSDPAVQRTYLCKLIESLTRWGSENGPNLQIVRDLIRKAYGGRAPKVLDPFAGGGAIPLEAMRLGCDVTANDYNPVAWFILKCTLEFPQRLAGKTWPLREPDPGDGPCASRPARRGLFETQAAEGDLAAHVRRWGRWVLERARADLSGFYPTVGGNTTVAYLWARTVPCPDPKCGATVPLLKTLWLCKKDNKRRALRLVPSRETGSVEFQVWEPGPADEVPRGTMAGAKAFCPVCHAHTQLPKDYIKAQGHAGQMGAQMTCVVVEGPAGKDYRAPTSDDMVVADRASQTLSAAAEGIDLGLPRESLPESGTSGAGRAFTIPQYGFKTWADLFTPRQLLALITFVRCTRAAWDAMAGLDYPDLWIEAIVAELACILDRQVDRHSTIVTWQPTGEKAGHTFTRYALPITWDFVEANPFSDSTSNFGDSIEWSAGVLDRIQSCCVSALPPDVTYKSATQWDSVEVFDSIITDPPYYDAIPYADISDYFYVWIKRVLNVSPSARLRSAFGDWQEVFSTSTTRKTGELVQQGSSDHGRKDKQGYESGMAEAFCRMDGALAANGAVVVVFAHKDPDAWETLAAAMIRSGFTVTASWPIDTEKGNRSRGMNSAALATSLWLVCRKRDENSGVGRYADVKRRMQERITERLRYFWDQGISGPDFVWAAVGPALESYSSFREVRRLDGSSFTVGEFLREVRRLVTDFALGQILHGASTEGLDEWTRYYLMHRASFGLGGASAGECILFAQGYGLELNDLCGHRGILTKGKARAAARARAAEGDEEADPAEESESGAAGGSASDLRLLSFEERTREDLGRPHPSGGLPLIDLLHRLMRLWSAGRNEELAASVAEHGLRQNALFWTVAQALVEQAEPQSRERSVLEALVAWGRGQAPQAGRMTLWEA